MRQNVRVHSPEELYTAQLRRSLALKQLQPAHPDEGALEMLAGLITLGIVLTFIALLVVLP